MSPQNYRAYIQPTKMRCRQKSKGLPARSGASQGIVTISQLDLTRRYLNFIINHNSSGPATPNQLSLTCRHNAEGQNRENIVTIQAKATVCSDLKLKTPKFLRCEMLDYATLLDNFEGKDYLHSTRSTTGPVNLSSPTVTGFWVAESCSRGVLRWTGCELHFGGVIEHGSITIL